MLIIGKCCQKVWEIDVKVQKYITSVEKNTSFSLYKFHSYKRIKLIRNTMFTLQVWLSFHSSSINSYSHISRIVFTASHHTCKQTRNAKQNQMTNKLQYTPARYFCFIMTYISRASQYYYYAWAFRCWINISLHSERESVAISIHPVYSSADMYAFHTPRHNNERSPNVSHFDVRHTGSDLVNTCVCVCVRERETDNRERKGEKESQKRSA